MSVIVEFRRSESTNGLVLYSMYVRNRGYTKWRFRATYSESRYLDLLDKSKLALVIAHSKMWVNQKTEISTDWISPRDWTDNKVQHFKSLYESGTTWDIICKQFNISRTTAKKYAQIWGYERKKPALSKRFSGHELDAINLHLDGKMSIQGLYNICDKRTRQAINKKICFLKMRRAKSLNKNKV